MSEASVLSLVERYPQRVALARHADDGSLFVALRRLEDRGFLRRRQDRYRLTQRGRDELAWTRALARLLSRNRA
jgi:DNA-binding PadR family transcriptional regulator